MSFQVLKARRARLRPAAELSGRAHGAAESSLAGCRALRFPRTLNAVRAAVAIDVIVAQIAPDLGPAVARASVVGLAQRIGVDEPMATPAQLARLLDELRPGLAVFVGRDVADDTIERLRGMLDAGERG